MWYITLGILEDLNPKLYSDIIYKNKQNIISYIN